MRNTMNTGIEQSNRFLGTQHKFIGVLALCFSILLAGGCSYFKKNDDEFKDASADEIYRLAQESMSKKNWETALQQLRALEARYPYGVYSHQSQLDTIYIHYRNQQPELAVAAADRFIRLNPTHDSVDYAYYLKGLASFDEDKSILGRIMGQDDLSDRDATAIYKAMIAFEDVYNLFPDSQYAPDAKRRADYLLNALARNEVMVANFYYARGADVAVVNRAKGVIENYASTPSAEEALALMMFSYERMGFDDLSSDARRVLELNFPNSEYLDKTLASVDFSTQYTGKKEREKDGESWFFPIIDRFKKDDEE